MIIHKSYKTELKPNNEQTTLFRKACGVRRMAYNWGLNQKRKAYPYMNEVADLVDTMVET